MIKSRSIVGDSSSRSVCIESSSRSACIEVSTVLSEFSTVLGDISTGVSRYIALKVVIGVNSPRDISTVPGVTSVTRVIARGTSEVVNGANYPRDSSNLSDLHLVLT